MNKVLILFYLIVAPTIVQAQILKPVKWSYAAKKVNSNEAVIFFKAVIDKGWHIYSQNVKDGGPTKTVFTFNKSSEYSVLGKTVEYGTCNDHQCLPPEDVVVGVVVK